MDEATQQDIVPAAVRDNEGVIPEDADILLEPLAEYAHHAWSEWIRWMFSYATKTPAGDYILPKAKVERWLRLMDTDYANLTEEEKYLDREEARDIIRLLYEVV